MKFVYIITSDLKDFYAEQTLASIYSLKFHNPEASVIILTDKTTSLKAHPSTINRCKELADDYCEIQVPQGYNNKQKSRFLKTSIPNYVKEDFLYLDGDTIITGDLNELNTMDVSIAAVLDAHGRQNVNYKLYEYMKITEKKKWRKDQFFNGGVLLVKNTNLSKNFFEDWHFLWKTELEKYGIENDQASLSQTDLKHGFVIKELEGKFNCQIFFSGSTKYLMAAKIIHYYADGGDENAFPLKNKETLRYIRENGITGPILAIVGSPLQAYLENSKILKGKELLIYDSALSKASRYMARRVKWINAVFDYFYNLYKKRYERL